MTGPIGLYQPGTSVLHRLPAGAKLAGLAAVLVAVLAFGSLAAVAAAAAGTVALVTLAGVSPATMVRQLRPVLWWAVPLFALQWATAGPVRAATVAGQLLLAVALAALVTLTTRVSAMLAAFEAALWPLRRLGLDPARVGLVLALTLRCVPLVTQVLAEARQAAWARGADRSPRALVVPTVVRLLKRADTIGEALAARGVDDEPAPAPDPRGDRSDRG